MFTKLPLFALCAGVAFGSPILPRQVPDPSLDPGILTPGEPARQPVKQATNANSRYGTVASPRVNTPQAQPEEFGIANTPPNVPSYNWDSKEIPADQPSPVGNRDRDYLRPTSPNAAEPLPQTAQTADWQMVAKPAPECPSAQRCLDTIEKNAMNKCAEEENNAENCLRRTQAAYDSCQRMCAATQKSAQAASVPRTGSKLRQVSSNPREEQFYNKLAEKNRKSRLAGPSYHTSKEQDEMSRRGRLGQELQNKRPSISSSSTPPITPMTYNDDSALIQPVIPDQYTGNGLLNNPNQPPTTMNRHGTLHDPTKNNNNNNNNDLSAAPNDPNLRNHALDPTQMDPETRIAGSRIGSRMRQEESPSLFDKPW